MILHLVWLIPALLLIALVLIEPRRLINAYLFLIVFILFAFTIAGFFVVQLSLWDKQTAIIFLIGGLLLIPLSVILSTIYLLFNGRQMMTFEGRRLANLLSLFYGLTILITLALHFLNHYFLIGKITELLDSLLIYGSFIYLSYIAYGLFYNLFPLTYQPDYIIILGSGLMGDKVPPLLAQRLDKGFFYYEKFGKQPTIIVSGGQGKDEAISEAEAMSRYLLDKGLASDKLLLEKQSTTTLENLTFSRNLIGESPDTRPRFLVVTNSFHSLRAGIYMRKLKLKGRSVGSKTALYYLPSAWIRETAGLFLMYWKWHAIIIGITILSWIRSFFF
ncbi:MULTISPECIES: YdcF family protein [unclassified Streptococcus]|uniref:YdcF family protein n=1 Tax=unclassified Streptococcus TaxID=2608887 RepID=UPI001071C9B8|nr:MULTISPECIES: YdcF family protein [unclassified Streptococcus]MBF0787369.1 YdcF family protein [Streptococcus sp. 19428wC2_LYSM12]MCQ9211092.1 YdcF family protein [Streptococcus sp. B01]MCQ9214367.1 YdcF family protein [Streptococcus sp. O1]TFV05713.1 YdcF family protein [Streptococcus sp. LYSM12]